MDGAGAVSGQSRGVVSCRFGSCWSSLRCGLGSRSGSGCRCPIKEVFVRDVGAADAF